MRKSKFYRKITSMAMVFAFLLLLVSPAFAVSVEREVEIGRSGGLKMEKKYGVAKDRRYAHRINLVGQRIAAISPRKDIKYHFKVLNTKKFNALAFPGGYIYATRGLMDYLNDGELAFVLGHETAHIVHRHSMSRAEKQILTTLGIFALAAVFNKGKINQGTANTALILSYVMSNQYSQADERTADSDGVKFMAKAGYNPKYAVSAMKKLKKKGGGNLGPLNTFLGSHPLPSNRIAAVERIGKETAFKSSLDNPPILAGKDYDKKGGSNTPHSASGEKYNPDKRIKIASAGKSSFSGKEVVIKPENTVHSLDSVDYRNLKAKQLQEGSSLLSWEREIKKSLEFVKPGISFTKDLGREAIKLTSRKTQPVISDERIIWVELFNDTRSPDNFMSGFRRNALPLILSRRSDFTRGGVSVKKNGSGYIHVVIVLK
ncbi:MAG: M48 family metalloprotease [Candidatus Eremiobacteraeota bacterium]|nr:M48 family metalloprotease [Candidatus Eremiobacteraeota bacterium]